MPRASTLSPTLENILNIARWAPSGDNAQPWTFEIVSDERVTLKVHCAAGNVYEYANGQPTLISGGALLENIALAAPAFGMKARWQYMGCTDRVHAIEISFEHDSSAIVSPLFSEIERRSVDRRPYRARPLTDSQKSSLAACLDDNIGITWFESFAARWKLAGLTRMATEIRLRIPETFDIHNRIVDWDKAQSPSGIPAMALGLDPLTLKIMRWTLARPQRTQFANALGSPSMAALQMDILPGLFSAAYFALIAKGAPQGTDPEPGQLLKIGQSVQRFWLHATALGLVMQPCLAPLAFAYYGRHKQHFTRHAPSQKAAIGLSRRLADIVSGGDQIAFLGRLGWPRSPSPSRSLRLPLSTMVRASTSQTAAR
jgi:hypothetical protein